LRATRRAFDADSLAATAPMIRATSSRSPVLNIGVTGHEPHVTDLGSVDDLEEELEFDRAAVEPVKVVDQHPVDKCVGQVSQHPLILGSALARIGRDVVVDLLTTQSPAQRRGQLLAVLHWRSTLAAVPSASLEMRA
jgi:hypothetical protein